MINNYYATTITVPERADVIRPVIAEMKRLGIPHRIYEDTNHKGCLWNSTRELMEICLDGRFKGKNIITTTDDITFCDGWFEKVDEAISKMGYDIVTLFTNLKYEPDDKFIKVACQNWWLYDVCIVFRAGLLNQDFFASFMEYCDPNTLHKFEKNHFDQRLSKFTYERGYKCGIIRPNFVELQDVRSTLGHKIKDSNKERKN